MSDAPDRYDTIIIGAGLSGLAAGIRLAYYDKRVCVLDRHNAVGGLNSFYRLRGVNHDVGLHAVTNWRPPGTKKGPLSKLLRQLRLSWEDFDLAPQVGSAVDFDGCRLKFTNDPTLLEAEVAERFPSQADGFRGLIEAVDAADPFDLSPEEVMARDVIGRHVDDPLLVDMLLCPILYYGSATPHDVEWRQFVILFRALYQEGFGRPRPGVRPIMRVLVRQFRSLGGKLKLKHGVASIDTDGSGRAHGVTLDDGTKLVADNVLSSAGSHETNRLVESEPPDADLYPAGQLSFVETIALLDRPPADYGHHETIVFFNRGDRFHYEGPETPIDPRSGVICVPNNYQYADPTPLEDGRVRITALADPDFWMTADEETYAAAKKRAHEELTDVVCDIVPDYRPYVTDIDTFTPRTVKKFTGHVNGCVYGSPKKLRDGRTHVDNLYVCGTDQGYLGIVGAMLSGVSVANMHLLK
ncbi:MAG: NAD(P)/FAD-dependent oxidoreductase [Planctomycetota bacterium]